LNLRSSVRFRLITIYCSWMMVVRMNMVQKILRTFHMHLSSIAQWLPEI
jgi:hypothetical protein